MKTISLISFAVCVVLATASSDFDLFDSLLNNQLDPRIVGGEDAKEGQFPYQVSLRLKLNKQHFCGGSILSSRFILTAGHCADGQMGSASQVYAVVGALQRLKGGIPIKLEKITQHPGWDRSQLANDVALIRTAEEIVFSDTVQPIALPKHNIEGNTKVLLSGWGRTSYPGNLPNNLQFTEPNTLSKEDCLKRFTGYPFAAYIRDTIVCTTNAANVGACHGDSGGPLVDATNPDNKELVGVVSWGIPCAKGFPDAFTRVYSFVDWIEEKIEEQSSDLE